MNIARVSQKPQAPESLGDEGKKLWKSLINDMVSLGLMTFLDKKPLEMACRYYELWLNADPEEGIKYSKQYMDIMTKFGATPKARQALEKPEMEEDHLSEDDTLLKGVLD